MTRRSDYSSNAPQGHSHSFNSPRKEVSSSLQERTSSEVVAAERSQTGPIRCRRWKAQANKRIAQHLGIENKPIRVQAVSGPTVGLVGPSLLLALCGGGQRASGRQRRCPVQEQGASVWRSGQGSSPGDAHKPFSVPKLGRMSLRPKGAAASLSGQGPGHLPEGAPVTVTEIAERPRKSPITPGLTRNRPNQPFLGGGS